MIVSQIFLNLFIAIVIDSFSNKAEDFALPVTDMDVVIFGEVWSKFDRDSSGYIPLIRIEEFIMALAKSET